MSRAQAGPGGRGEARTARGPGRRWAALGKEKPLRKGTGREKCGERLEPRGHGGLEKPESVILGEAQWRPEGHEAGREGGFSAGMSTGRRGCPAGPEEAPEGFLGQNID